MGVFLLGTLIFLLLFVVFVLCLVNLLREEDIMASVAELDAKVDEVAASQAAVIARLEAIIAELEQGGGINPAELDPIIAKLQAIKDAADSHRP